MKPQTTNTPSSELIGAVDGALDSKSFDSIESKISQIEEKSNESVNTGDSIEIVEIPTETFVVGLNHRVVGKTEPYNLSDPGDFTPTEVTFSDLAKHHSNGHPWMPSILDAGEGRKKIHANTAHVVALDFDGGITIEEFKNSDFAKKYCGLAIESTSSTPEKNKFRAVFRLPQPITAETGGHEKIGQCLKFLSDVAFPSLPDKQCLHSACIFFGGKGREPFIKDDSKMLPEDFFDSVDAVAKEAAEKSEKQKEERRLRAEEFRKNNPNISKEDTVNLLRDALNHIDARVKGSGNYPVCLHVLMGLHHAVFVDESITADDAFELIDEWSPTDSSEGWYPERKWITFGNYSGKSEITIASIFYYAQQEGWIHPHKKKVVENSDGTYDFEKIMDGEIEIVDESKFEVVTTVEEAVFKVVFDSGEGDWITVDGAFYKYDREVGFFKSVDNAIVKKLIGEALPKLFKIKTNKRTGEISKIYCFATQKNAKDSFQWCSVLLHREQSKNNHLLAFRNGTVESFTGKIRPHDRNDFLTFGIDAEYKENTECPKVFSDFISKSFGEEFLPNIRAILAMYLKPSFPFGYFAHIIGKSGSGKGTFIRFLKSLFPVGNVRSIDKFALLNDPDKRHQSIKNTRLCCFMDVAGSTLQTDLGGFYELVDGGSLAGRALHSSDTYERSWNTRFIVASVSALSLENSGTGWKRRCLQLPTKQRDGEPDENLGAKLEACRSDVISWALALENSIAMNIIKKWYSSNESLQDLQRVQDLRGDAILTFIDMCLRPSEDYEKDELLTPTRLHTYFGSFAKAFGYQSLNFSNFKQRILDKLGVFYRKRGKTSITKGERVNIPKHFINIVTLPDVFFTYENATDDVICQKSRCREGGLEDFDKFLSAVSPSVSPCLTPVSPSSETLREGETLTNQGFLETVSTVSTVSPYFEDKVQKENALNLALTNASHSPPEGKKCLNAKNLGETVETPETDFKNPVVSTVSASKSVSPLSHPPMRQGETEGETVTESTKKTTPNAVKSLSLEVEHIFNCGSIEQYGFAIVEKMNRLGLSFGELEIPRICREAFEAWQYGEQPFEVI